jgi:hypothetical protein
VKVPTDAGRMRIMDELDALIHNVYCVHVDEIGIAGLSRFVGKIK